MKLEDQNDNVKCENQSTVLSESVIIDDLSNFAVDEEFSPQSLPSFCVSGHGWCENGICYACCKNKWYHFQDPDDSRLKLTCKKAKAKTYSYQCDGRSYFTTCGM